MQQSLIQNGLVPGLGFRDILIEGSYISRVETSLDEGLYPSAKKINAKDKLVYPGFINTHHHLTQSLAKAIPAGINCDLNDWLPVVPFALFDKLTPEIVYYSAVLGLYELLRSGCTTCADHFYIYHQFFDQDIEHALVQAAQDVGIRFVLCRGGSTHTGSHKGVRAAKLTNESLDLFLKRTENTVSRFHQTTTDSMFKVAVAPTTIVHSSPPEDLKQISAFARKHGLRMHSHLLEVSFDEEMAQKNYGMSAIDYAESTGWLGSDVWFAHLVKADADAIEKLALTKTGIAHCPSSNCRLGSGVANVIQMASKGVPISIGVDGSASAESASMVNETMLTWLVHRALHGVQATRLEQVFDWASTSGARILGFENLGKIEEGQLADICIYELDQARFDGVWMKEWAPIVCGEPISVEAVFVNGDCIFKNGELVHLDIDEVRQKAKLCVLKLMESEDPLD